MKSIPGILNESFNTRKGVGSRAKGEDTYVKMLCAGVKTGEDARLFLGHVYKKIATETKSCMAGSCAVTAMITDDKRITVASLGDSQVEIYVYDPETGRVTGEQVNKLLHRPSALEERQRLEAMGCGMFINTQNRLSPYVRGGLAISRAFGDAGYQDLGLVSDPDFYVVDLMDPKYVGKRVFLEVTCDGSFEKKANLEAHAYALEQIIKFKNAPNVAERINNMARNYGGSTDDMTTYFMELKIDELELSNGALAMSVFDGHSGRCVAQIAADIMGAYKIDMARESQRLGDINVAAILVAFSLDLQDAASASIAPITTTEADGFMLTGEDIPQLGEQRNEMGRSPAL